MCGKLLGTLTANWTEARTMKYTNFLAKYINSPSKLHWIIHVVLCQVSVMCNNRLGIGISELQDRAEPHSAFNTTSKWILLVFNFYIFPISVMFANILISNTTTELALIN